MVARPFMLRGFTANFLVDQPHEELRTALPPDLDLPGREVRRPKSERNSDSDRQGKKYPKGAEGLQNIFGWSGRKISREKKERNRWRRKENLRRFPALRKPSGSSHLKAERTEKKAQERKADRQGGICPESTLADELGRRRTTPKKKKIENSTPFDCCVPRKGAAQARGVRFRSRTGEERGGPWSVKEKNSRPRDPGADAWSKRSWRRGKKKPWKRKSRLKRVRLNLNADEVERKRVADAIPA